MSESRGIPEPYASVVLRQMNGASDEEIAADLDLSVAEVQHLGREGQRIGAEIMSSPEVRAEIARHVEELSRLPDDRRASASQLLSSGTFLTVERADPTEMGEPPPDACVWFNDIAGHDFDDFVDETVLVLRSRPEVVAADREDRELITVTGSVDTDSLEADLRAWWTTRLQGEARS
jgi:hypothetical protein